MTLSRRSFLKASGSLGGTLILTHAVEPSALLALAADPGLAPYLSGQRMSATPATNYRAYRSKIVHDPSLATWVQVDLGKGIGIDEVLLYPANERMYPGRDQYYAGEGFPLRFRIEAWDDPESAH